jgi:predicted lipoprotein with Yx(FWY)xxD motif
MKRIRGNEGRLRLLRGNPGSAPARSTDGRPSTYQAAGDTRQERWVQIMLHGKRAIFAIAILPVLAVVLAACGSSDSSDDSSATAASDSGSGGQTVTTKSISGTGDVLVDSSGAALYTNDMDTRSKVACDGECLTEWVPLAAPTGGSPSSSDSAVESKLGTMQRPDGSSQVTLDGMPLYTFVDDSPGQVTGNGFTDAFGGTTFVWTVAAAPGGSTESGGGSTTNAPSNGPSAY